jgi:AraC family transcriptional activator of pobA
MVAPRNVPIHPLTDYGPEMSAGQQFFVGRFEHSITSRPNRLRFHRHTYYEVFWISGRGSFFADFREYPIADPTLIFVSPGQVHRWNQKPRITGPMICFTQEFYDGKEPPPSSLLDHSFWFPFETPPLVTVGENQVAKFDPLWNEMEAEATPSKERDDIVRALLRLLFYKAARTVAESMPPMVPVRQINIPGLRIQRMFSWLPSGELGGPELPPIESP